MKRALITLLLLGVTLCGCNQPRRPAVLPPNATGNLAEAQRLFDEGLRAQRGKNYAKAEELYQQATAASTDFAAAWNNLGTVLLEQSKYLEAADAFRVAAGKNIGDPRPYENLGYVYATRGWSEEGLKYYGLALERSPNSITALRGAVATGKQLSVSNEKALEWARLGMLIETDPTWRDVFQREAMRIQAVLADKGKPTNSAGAATSR